MIEVDLVMFTTFTLGVDGPHVRWVEILQATKAFWGLWSKFHLLFGTGPFNYTFYDQIRGCEIA